MIDPTATTYLCATNSTEVPTVIGGPFDGTTYGVAGRIEACARRYSALVVEVQSDDIMLFTLTIHPNAAPEFEYVGYTDQFVSEDA